MTTTNLKNTIKNHLSQTYMMQLATVSGGQPWCCTVYFIIDEDLNLYWASLPTRRHSQEISGHSKVAAAIPIIHVKGQKVTGIQVEGEAKIIEDTEAIGPIAEQYARKFGRSAQWAKDFTDQKTEHKLYKLTPKLFVLFDEVNHPHNTRLEWIP